MAKNVLITGGTGTVGTRLTEMLLVKGYSVSYLSRKKETIPNVTVYQWDVAKGQLDEQALAEADYLIHLAGAGVADERWTAKRKEEIITSRTQTIELIAEKLKSMPHHIQSFVAASGISLYGMDTGDALNTESTPLGQGFLAEVTDVWEKASESVHQLGIRTVKLRIGIVLSKTGGALERIVQPIRLGAGAALGSGEQIISWIHLDDLCRLFIKSMEDSQMQGAYNAVAPAAVSNKQLTQAAAKVLDKPLWLPNVPAFALKLAFGELAGAVLGSVWVQSDRLKETDFSFQYGDIHSALQDLLVG